MKRGVAPPSSSPQNAVVTRLRRDEYLHVLDDNENTTRCIVGPITFTRKSHEVLVEGPSKCISLPPQTYCRVGNPCVRGAGGAPELDANGEAKVRYGDEEVRVNDGRQWTSPFPLYPGEALKDASEHPIKKLTVVARNTALLLRAEQDFVDADGKDRKAGDEWLFEGPATYVPTEKVKFVSKCNARVIKPNEALHMRARIDFVDRDGKQRKGGEEWLVKSDGAYLPAAEEEVVSTVEARVVTDRKAVEVEALITHVDGFGKKRAAGERWLVTSKDTSSFIPEVTEKVTRTVPITTLSNRQYCVVVDPFKNGVQLFGHREIRRGEGEGTSFFLYPGERLVSDKVLDVQVLGADEALLVKAIEGFKDGKTQRKAGDRWLLRGPLEYVPPVEVEVVDKRTTIPLDENEGIYIRNLNTGEVSMVTNTAHMRAAEEVLWEKDVPPVVEELLHLGGSKHAIRDSKLQIPVRDKTRAVRLNIAHNAAVQVYDYAGKEPKVIFGPDLVMLEPDECFTVLSLSGDTPKVPHVIKSVQLQLGPDFMTDVITVETSDHARLELKLSYNWKFDVDSNTPQEEAKKIFCVPDFVGDACKAIAGRVRGQVAMESFETFHRNSAKIIRAAVFGLDDTKKVRDRFEFPANRLVIVNVDIQSVEPVDQRTRDSLQKSVQLAIEIMTKSQEAAARHRAEREAQKANSELERRKLRDSSESEAQKKEFLKLQAENEAIEATGQARAEAEARAEAMIIEANSELEQANLKADAQRITAQADLEMLTGKNKSALDYQKRADDIEVTKVSKLSQIEADKFAATMEAIGPETVLAMAKAGPELQAQLLEGLGLKGYLITDGNSPINLFNTAGGMIGGAN
ncbi:Major vault protein [Diplonema papillatum]|nr:Major vault protein [Diplonema papillatum]